MSLAEQFLRKASEQAKVSSTVGVFVERTVDGLARVNVQGSTVDVRLDGWNPPIPGMPVRVETLNGIMRVKGPSQALSARGEVVADVGGGVAAIVLVDGEEYTLPVMAPYVPIPADIVVINWQSGHVLGEEASAPDTVAPPTVGAGGSSFSSLLVQATNSGKWDTTYSNYWGGSEVWASNNNDGLWVYGGRFSALAGANVSRVEIFLPLIQQVGSASVGLHAYSTIPGGAPTIGSLVALSSRNGWVQLPTEWGNYLRDNPGSGVGVVSPSGGFNKWRGVGQDGLSGALRFDGTR